MKNRKEFREPDEAHQKMSLRKQGSLNPNYGKARDEATKEKISQSLQKYWQTIPSKNNLNNSDHE